MLPRDSVASLCVAAHLVHELQSELPEAIDGVHRHGSASGYAPDRAEVLSQNAPHSRPLDPAANVHVQVRHLLPRSKKEMMDDDTRFALSRLCYGSVIVSLRLWFQAAIAGDVYVVHVVFILRLCFSRSLFFFKKSPKKEKKSVFPASPLRYTGGSTDTRNKPTSASSNDD